MAIISLIPIVAGGSATNWTFQIGDNTVTDNSQNTEINLSNLIDTDAIVDRATLAFTCSQDVIPESHIKACQEYNAGK